MKEIEITRQNLESFANILRKEDEEEIIASLGQNYREKFIEIILKNKKGATFLAKQSKKNIPVALGGICPLELEGKKVGRVWLLCSCGAYFYRHEIYKYILQKLEVFKAEYEILFNLIYKSNFKSLNWIKKLGFKTVELENKNYKLFYFRKGEGDIDLRYIARE